MTCIPNRFGILSTDPFQAIKILYSPHPIIFSPGIFCSSFFSCRSAWTSSQSHPSIYLILSHFYSHSLLFHSLSLYITCTPSTHYYILLQYQFKPLCFILYILTTTILSSVNSLTLLLILGCACAETLSRQTCFFFSASPVRLYSSFQTI